MFTLMLTKNNEPIQPLKALQVVRIDDVIMFGAVDGWTYASPVEDDEGVITYPNTYAIEPYNDKAIAPNMRIVSTTYTKVNGIWEPVHIVEAVPEIPAYIRRKLMPNKSMVEFRKALRNVKVVQREGLDELDGIFEEDILAKIDLIADKDLAAEARDFFMFAMYIERANTWVDVLGNMFGLTPEQIDDYWMLP